MLTKKGSYQWTVCLMLISLSAFAGSDVDEVKKIQAEISSIYDKPNLKVESSPVAIEGNYAIADWTQGKRGGRALLRQSEGKWHIMACGADGLKDVKTLTEAGISDEAAHNLVAKLSSAEKAVNPKRLKQFSLFGTKEDPMHETEHHGH